MKKKTIVSVSLLGFFLVGLVALAPYLFHKSPSAKPDTVVALSAPPKGNSMGEIAHLDNSNPGPGTHPNPGPNSQNEAERKDMRPIRSKPQNIKPEKPLPVIGKPKPPQSEETSVTTGNKPITPPAIFDPVSPGSGESSTSNDQPSRWGIAALATNSGVDAGVVYQLAEISMLGDISLDVIVAVKEAGIGISKDISPKFALGVAGTIAYENGAPEVGIYLKYSF